MTIFCLTTAISARSEHHSAQPPWNMNMNKRKAEKEQASGRSVVDRLRGVLTPQVALELANGHLENALKTKNSEVALQFCKDAGGVLARIPTSVRKTSRDEDRDLCNKIATTHFKLGKLLDDWGFSDKAQDNYKNEKKWRRDVQLPGQSSSHSENAALPP
ncbi:hypothetical protein EDD21DRAFT_408311, partial [Dissophora ornata]